MALRSPDMSDTQVTLVTCVSDNLVWV
jgi:hypothetical protein